jgi:hypothetical protein
VRNVYVIDYAPLPTNLASKCFSHSVIYVDQDSWAYMGGEDYDVEGKLWKEYINANMELPDKSQGGDYIIGHHGVTLNLKENHVTVVTLASAPKLDGDVPVEYRNAADSALPGSLLTINK